MNAYFGKPIFWATLFFFVFASTLFSQTNTFPSSGNVGIGTLNPTSNFEVYKWNGASHARIYTNQHGGTATLEIAGGVASFGSLYSGWSFYHSHNNTNKDLYLRYGLSGDPDFVFGDTGNLGIGTSNPSQRLEIFNPNLFNTNMEAQAQDHISFTSNTAGLGNFFGGLTWKVGSRRRAAIAAVQEHSDSDHVGLAFFTRGTDGPGPIYESVRITRNGSMGIGTTSPDSKLTVKGNIHAEEVKVDLSVPGPDYVFKEDYDLKSLEEVQNYIKENGHLPNIPSAKEMEANGVQLGEMNMKLLEKIEELTLYILQQEQTIKRLEKQNQIVQNLAVEFEKIIEKTQKDE